LLEGRTVHIRDAALDLEYNVPDVLKAAGNRAMIGVPLLREGAPIGVLVLTRSVARPFTEKQIALATTFADQAVIAIENVRLFKETTEALEQQTATSEILRVISQSPRDVQPVFDFMSNAALKLCSASSAIVTTYDGELVRLSALANVDPEGAEAVRQTFPSPASSGNASARAVLTGSVVSISDVLDDPDFTVKANAVRAGFRSVLAVRCCARRPIGTITVRRRARTCPDKQVALLRTFADQAVIAIENVRLFTELEARTAELTKSVGELRALGEVGRRSAQRSTWRPFFPRSSLRPHSLPAWTADRYGNTTKRARSSTCTQRTGCPMIWSRCSELRLSGRERVRWDGWR
jgi:GAF domain-containing protein